MPRGARLVPVAASAWVAALVLVAHPAASGWIALGAGGLSLALLAAIAARRRRPGDRSGAAPLVLLLIATAVMCCACQVALAQPTRQQAGDLALSGGRAVEIGAVVVGKVERRAGGIVEFDAVATTIRTGDRVRSVSMPVAVRVPPDDVAGDRLDVGALVTARGTAREGDPGDRAVLRVFAAAGVTVTDAPSGPFDATSSLRRGLVAAVAGLPEPGAGLVPGLSVGDTTAVGEDLDAAMKRSALSHLTAVSGANCALVVGLAFAAVAALGGGRRWRVAGGLIALAGFVLLVTPEPSVVRAGAMSAIAMLALLLGRTGAGLAILSLAVTGLLIVDPWLAGSIGFALSAAATASLLVVAAPLARGLARGMPRPLALGISVPLAAQLACGPLLVLIDPAVPLYGVAANLLAAPAAPVATVVGLAACLAAPLPWLQSGLAAIAWVPAAWIAGVASTVSELPGDRMPWLEGWPGAVLLAVAGAAAAVAIMPAGRGRVRHLHRAGVLIVAITAGVATGAWALGSVAGRWTVPAPWTVLACDVGQGDAVLLRSAGAVALIDTGPDAAALDRCLSRVGVAHVDLLVLTHFDLDHIGGAAAVTGRVGTVVHGPVPVEGAAVLDELAGRGAHVREVARGVAGTLGNARWRVLWPPAEGHAFPPGNDASVVVDVRGGGIPATLLLGDLAAAPQRSLLASGALITPLDVVKVAHHGSADQAATLYDHLGAAVALFTVGSGNTFGHPREEILSHVIGLGAAVARTDTHGMIAIWRDGEDVAVWRDRGDVGSGP